MNTNQITDPEIRKELRDLDARYIRAKFHLRMAIDQMKALNRDYGLTYGEDDDDTLSVIKAAVNQLNADHDYMIEFVYAVNDIPPATAVGTTNSKGETK